MKEIKEKLIKYTETLIDFCKFQTTSAMYDNPVSKINAADARLCFEEAAKELNQTLQNAIPQWQPIETAPRPSEAFDFDFPEALYFSEKDGIQQGQCLTLYLGEEDNPVFGFQFDSESVDLHPTHWMPLPPPPTSTEISL
jgi:hypothetical protein